MAPSKQAGLRSGDRFFKINGVPQSGWLKPKKRSLIGGGGGGGGSGKSDPQLAATFGSLMGTKLAIAYAKAG